MTDKKWRTQDRIKFDRFVEEMKDAINEWGMDQVQTALDEIAEEAEAAECARQDCTCRMSVVGPTDIDPPEVKRDKWCPVHGRDPDYERDRQIDEHWFDGV
jgi:hypothetical protein